MTGIVYSRNVGALLNVQPSVRPQSASAGTINGVAIDRAAHYMPLSCVLHTSAGAVSGAPSTTSVQSKIQHSADNSTWADYTDPDTGTTAQAAALTAQNTANSLSVDLINANRYIRAVTVVAFTGGTSPAALVATGIVLGGEAALAAS